MLSHDLVASCFMIFRFYLSPHLVPGSLHVHECMPNSALAENNPACAKLLRKPAARWRSVSPRFKHGQNGHQVLHREKRAWVGFSMVYTLEDDPMEPENHWLVEDNSLSGSHSQGLGEFSGV